MNSKIAKLRVIMNNFFQKNWASVIFGGFVIILLCCSIIAYYPLLLLINNEEINLSTIFLTFSISFYGWLLFKALKTIDLNNNQ